MNQVGLGLSRNNVAAVKDFDFESGESSLARIKLDKNVTAFVRVGDEAIDCRVRGSKAFEKRLTPVENDSSYIKVTREASGKYEVQRLSEADVEALDNDVKKLMTERSSGLVLQSVAPLDDNTFSARIGASQEPGSWSFRAKDPNEKSFNWKGLQPIDPGKPRLGDEAGKPKRFVQDPKALQRFKDEGLWDKSRELNAALVDFAREEDKMQQQVEQARLAKSQILMRFNMMKHDQVAADDDPAVILKNAATGACDAAGIARQALDDLTPEMGMEEGVKLIGETFDARLDVLQKEFDELQESHLQKAQEMYSQSKEAN